MTHFEDLSNELFYEIFDYFESCYIYETFSCLNSRFYHLIHGSFQPMKIHLSLLSKPAFHYRCENIILPNTHRILSLRLSEYLVIDNFFKLFLLNSSFHRLESLILNNINSDKLIPILLSLTALPRLFSLTITSIIRIDSEEIHPSLILCLPTLKYCKLSEDFSLSFHLDNDTYSPLEHLIINRRCHLNELFELLIYTPQLKRLSCKLSTMQSSLSHVSPIPIDLTHISLQLNDTSFDEFEWIISSLGSHLQVLRISAENDNGFLNANRWQRLILRQMPLLRRFRFHYRTNLNSSFDSYNSYYTLMKEFDTLFWYDRQWFFTYQFCKSNDNGYWIRFYSTKPYRWSHYDFHEVINQQYDSGLNLACKVNIHKLQPIIQYSKFPRTTRLTLSEGKLSENHLFIHKFTRLFSSMHLVELVISDRNLRFEQLLILLQQFPNIQLLTIPISILYLSTPQSPTNRLIINKNQIQKVTLVNQCSLGDIQILLRLCSCLQNLNIETENDNLLLIVQFLLRKNNPGIPEDRLFSKHGNVWIQGYMNCIYCTKNQKFKPVLPCNHRLSSICCRNINYRMLKKIQTMIDHEIFLGDYSIEYLDQNMYLWW